MYIRVANFETAYGGILGGAGDVLDATGDLTWGTITVPTEKTITVTGDNSGDIACGSLTFSGDMAAFRVTKVNGVVLATPWNPAVDGNFYFAMNNGESKTFTLMPIFVDGTEQSMLIEVLRGDTTLDDSIMASHTFEDAFLGTCNAVVGVIACYSCKDFAIGALANDDAPFVDLLGVAPSLVCVNPPSQQVVATSFVVPSLQKAVRVDAQGNLSAGIIRAASALSAGPAAGIVLMYHQQNGVGTSHQKWFCTGGRVGQNFSPDFDLDYRTSVSAQEVRASWAAIMDYAGMPVPNWMTFAWRKDGGTTYFYVSLVGGAFGGLRTSSAASVWTPRNGFALMFEKGGSYAAVVNRQFCGMGLFSSASVAELQAIHEAIA